MKGLTVEKEVYWPVTCERCGCGYGYRLSAKGTGMTRTNKGAYNGFMALTEQGDAQRRDDAYRAVYDT